jgi:hypothetical protein
VALLTAVPVALHANDALLETQLELDTRLIVEYRLWQTDPAYASTPENWTRFAAWLLDHEQLLERARSLHPDQGDAIEAEYHRHRLFAFAAVLVRYLALWGLPLGLAYAAGYLRERRGTTRSA